MDFRLQEPSNDVRSGVGHMSSRDSRRYVSLLAVFIILTLLDSTSCCCGNNVCFHTKYCGRKTYSVSLGLQRRCYWMEILAELCPSSGFDDYIKICMTD